MGNVDGCQRLQLSLRVANFTQIVNQHKEPQMNSANYGVRNVFQMVNSALKNQLVPHSQPKILA